MRAGFTNRSRHAMVARAHENENRIGETYLAAPSSMKLAGAIIAIGGVTLICGRLLGFNGPLAFWGGLGVVFGAASAAYANVLVKARSIQLAPAMLAAWQMIFGIAPLLVLGFAVDGNPA